jgi:hypothetical protein
MGAKGEAGAPGKPSNHITTHWERQDNKGLGSELIKPRAQRCFSTSQPNRSKRGVRGCRGKGLAKNRMKIWGSHCRGVWRGYLESRGRKGMRRRLPVSCQFDVTCVTQNLLTSNDTGFQLTVENPRRNGPAIPLELVLMVLASMPTLLPRTSDESCTLFLGRDLARRPSSHVDSEVETHSPVCVKVGGAQENSVGSVRTKRAARGE